VRGAARLLLANHPSSPANTEPTQLLRIEEELGTEAVYAGESYAHIAWDSHA